LTDSFTTVPVILVEEVTDAWRLFQQGCKCVVEALGKSLKPHLILNVAMAGYSNCFIRWRLLKTPLLRTTWMTMNIQG